MPSKKNKFFSWTIISDNVVVKKTDFSVFTNHATNIAVQLRPFFKIQDLQPGQKIAVTFIFQGIEYSGHIRRTNSTAKQTIMDFTPELQNQFNAAQPDAVSTKNYPDLYVKADGPNKFVLWFNNSTESELNDRIISDISTENLETEVVSRIEGGKKQYYVTRYERDPENRKLAIKLHEPVCAVCGFNFEKFYGEAGKNFIEVHHIKPLSEYDAATEVDPEKDLICLCSNCHRMIHRRKGEVYTVEELRKMVRENGCIAEIDGQMISYRKITFKK